MRFVYRVGCAVALVACADSQNPTVPASRHLQPTDAPLAPGSTTTQFDPRSIPDRIEELVGQRLAKVSIPPDGYSLTSDAVHPDIACPRKIPPRAANGVNSCDSVAGSLDCRGLDDADG
jgi:hypothetical protein